MGKLALWIFPLAFAAGVQPSTPPVPSAVEPVLDRPGSAASVSEALKLTDVESDALALEPESCSEYFSCSGGLHGAVKGCSCHEHCHLFGDCCLDSGGINATDAEPIPRETYVCYSPTQGASDGRGVYLVNSCPAGYDERTVRAACHRAVPGETNAAGIFPGLVTDARTGVTYANVHCATCHGKKTDEVLGWYRKYTCPAEESNDSSEAPAAENGSLAAASAEEERHAEAAVWKAGSSAEELADESDSRASSNVSSAARRSDTLSYISRRCTLSYVPPTVTARLQTCVVDLVQDCPPGTDQSLGDDCESGPFRVVYSRDGLSAFKNHACEACSNSSSDALRCWRRQNSPSWFLSVDVAVSLSFEVILTPDRTICPRTSLGVSDDVCQALSACNDKSRGFRKETGCLPLCLSGAASAGGCHGRNGDLNCTNLPWRRAKMAATERRNETAVEIVADLLVIHYSDSSSHCVHCKSVETYANFTVMSNGSVELPKWPHVYDFPFYVVSEGNATLCIVADFEPSYFGGCGSIPVEVNLTLLVTSEVALALYFLLVAVLSKLRSFSGRMITCQATAYFVGFLLFLIRPLASQPAGICVAISAATHYFLLAAFVWTTLYAIEIVRALSFKLVQARGRRRMAAYAAIGWLVPAAIVAAAMAADAYELVLRPSYGSPQCFINNRAGNKVFFIFPLCVLLCVDVFIYCYMIVKLVRIVRETKMARQSHGEKLQLCCQLAFSLGFVWLLAVVDTDNPTAYCAFSAVNSLQGLFILFIFVGKRSVCGSLLATIRATVSQLLTNSTSASYSQHPSLTSK